MEEFLKQNYALLTHSVELLAVISGMVSYRKYKSTAVKCFIFFLVYAFITDFLGNYPRYFMSWGIFDLIKGTAVESNYLWYTVFWGMGSALFYMFFFRRIVNDYRKKSILKYAILFFVIGSIAQFAFHFQSHNTEYRIAIFVAGSFLILGSVFLYFIEVLESDKVLTFYKSIYFWISAVILIWFLITTPLIFYDIYFSTADWNFILLKWQIYLFANMFMYLSFSFALLWCKPQND